MCRQPGIVGGASGKTGAGKVAEARCGAHSGRGLEEHPGLEAGESGGDGLE